VVNLLGGRNAVISPCFFGIKYNPCRQGLYSPDELLKMSSSGYTLDEEIYRD
jgi:hypothetical protein